MSNNIDITIYDFENICRTCLSKEDLHPLYENFSHSKCLVEMLISCTPIKFTKDDGLPTQICTNCIDDINQAFSFTKRCETTDTILRNCVKNFKTDLPNNLSLSQKVEPIIKTEDEMENNVEIEYKELVEVKQEKDVTIEFGEHNIEVNEEKNMEYDKIYDDPLYERCGEDDNKNQDKNNKNLFKNLNLLQIHQSVHTGKEKDEVQIKYGEPVVVMQEEALIIENKCNETSDDPVDEQDETSIHMRIHSSKKPFTCKICNKIFNQPNSLKKHIRIHTGEKPYTCEASSKASARNDGLQSHMKIHTGEKTYTCVFCSKDFAQLGHLKDHMKMHIGEKPYTCEVCNRDFTTIGQLNRHMKIHTGEKPYTCEVCSKAFTQLSNLRIHMKIHTGEKPYTCTVCSKTFTHLRTLQSHMKIHTGEKPYICEVCSKSFTQLGTLQSHMKIHTGEKSYTCEVCSRAFARISTLQSHMKIHVRRSPADTKYKSLTQSNEIA